MNFQYYSLFLSLGIILFSVPVIAQDYLALQGSATGSGGGNGSIVVEIWSAATGGSLLYNSSNDFNNVINNSRYDILLGNGTNPLSLNFSGTYYMEMYINGRDIDFNTSERQVFQSPVGNITVDDPIKTSSSSTYALNVNDRFNVSGATGDTTISGVVNISGATTLSGVTTVANFFNVTPATSAVRTNGTVTVGSTAVIQSTDADDALNVSNGGGNFRGQLGVQNYTSATIPALTVNYGFNVSGATGELRTNGSLTIISTDDDDSINTTGGIFIGQGNPGAQLGIGGLTISDVGVITTDTAIGPAAGRGNIVIRSLTAQALSINAGFNVSGPTLEMRTNGTITVLNTDSDDAINTTGGLSAGNIGGDYMQFVPGDPNTIFTVKKIFNISAAGNVRVGSGAAGTVTILSTDADDALNVTGSIAQQGAAVTIGNAESTTQHRLEIFDGGTNKCAYIRLFDDLGEDWFLFANSTGQLRMVANAPTGAGQCNTGGGSVGGQPP